MHLLSYIGKTKNINTKILKHIKAKKIVLVSISKVFKNIYRSSLGLDNNGLMLLVSFLYRNDRFKYECY